MGEGGVADGSAVPARDVLSEPAEGERPMQRAAPVPAKKERERKKEKLVL